MRRLLEPVLIFALIMIYIWKLRSVYPYFWILIPRPAARLAPPAPRKPPRSWVRFVFPAEPLDENRPLINPDRRRPAIHRRPVAHTPPDRFSWSRLRTRSLSTVGPRPAIRAQR